MDGMIFYHANAEKQELSVIDSLKTLDFEVNVGKSATVIDNSFQIAINELLWQKSPVVVGDLIYVPGTEWGGVITQITHKTADAIIVVEGVTWRGLLYYLVIEPPEGEAYLHFTNIDANSAIALAMDDRYADLFEVTSETAGVNVSGDWRYRTVADCLNSTLSDYGLRLKIVWDNTISKAVLSAEAVNELTDEIELSQDYGVDFISKEGRAIPYNHALALGKGELTERMVANVYYMNGQYYTAKPAGWDEDEQKTLIFDYPNVETAEELIRSATDKLSQNIPTKSFSINEVTANIPAELGDIIGARDRMTGMVGQSRVVRKIMKNKDVGISIELGVE